jgi:hypothetical protein
MLNISTRVGYSLDEFNQEIQDQPLSSGQTQLSPLLENFEKPGLRYRLENSRKMLDQSYVQLNKRFRIVLGAHYESLSVSDCSPV